MTWMPWRFAGRVDGTWQLGKDQTTHLPEARGPVDIRVERGLVVVTREGDLEDHVLGAGDALVLPARGKVVAWALQPTRATVRDARPGAPGEGRRELVPARATAMSLVPKNRG